MKHFPEQFINSAGGNQKPLLELQGVQESESREFQAEERKMNCTGRELGEAITHMQGRPKALKSHKAVTLYIKLLDFKGAFTEVALIFFCMSSLFKKEEGKKKKGAANFTFLLSQS